MYDLAALCVRGAGGPWHRRRLSIGFALGGRGIPRVRRTPCARGSSRPLFRPRGGRPSVGARGACLGGQLWGNSTQGRLGGGALSQIAPVAPSFVQLRALGARFRPHFWGAARRGFGWVALVISFLLDILILSGLDLVSRPLFWATTLSRRLWRRRGVGPAESGPTTARPPGTDEEADSDVYRGVLRGRTGLPSPTTCSVSAAGSNVCSEAPSDSARAFVAGSAAIAARWSSATAASGVLHRRGLSL